MKTSQPFLCLLLTACAASPPPGLDAGVGDALHAAWTAHIQAAQRKDLAGVLDLYTEDAIYAVGTPLRRGRTEIEAMEREGLASSDVRHATHSTAALRVRDARAFELGTVVGEVAVAGQPAQHVVFDYAAEWHRERDGTWRIAHLVGALVGD